MSDQPVIARWTATLEDLPEVSKVVAAHILRAASDPVVVWLRGDLGAGKTTLAKELLYALGLPREVPVLSPTYTYMTEYKLKQGLFAHMDLYRLVEGDNDSVEMLLSGRQFKGLIVEWPERAPTSPFLERAFEINLSIRGDGEQRLIEFRQ
jgi:tRNA threonylcarbamoyladenosine biosynthesis protein TsaE